MQNANEDKFGIIVDPKYKFKSLEQANNYVDGLEEKLNRKADAEEFEITTAFPEERKRYINYCLSLLTRSNLPFVSEERIVKAHSVLSLITRGFSHEKIAGYLRSNGFGNVKLQDVKDVEADALKMVQDCIRRVQGSKIPVFNG